MSDFAADIRKGLESVTKEWRTAKKKEERVSSSRLDVMRYNPPAVTIKRVAFTVMEEAYNKASSNGKYYANARQIMYAARPQIIKQADKPWEKSTDKYFTQTLLKDYIEEYNPGWKVVWDARGHFTEPHTGRVVNVGGIEVEKYHRGWSSEFESFPRPGIRSSVDTHGPQNRFGSVLFIEKEGFDEILKDAGIGDRYDMAIMSTKGIPVGAACELLSRLPGESVKVFVLHDFDLAGFKIVRTLRKGTRLQHGTDVVDLGFRLADIQELDREEVHYSQQKDPKRYLRRCGATEEECAILVRDGGWREWDGERVELNAMTSEELITWIEGKMEEHGIEKVIPGEAKFTGKPGGTTAP